MLHSTCVLDGMEDMRPPAVTASVLCEAAEIQPFVMHSDDWHCRSSDTHESLHTHICAHAETLSGANMLDTNLDWTQQISGQWSLFILE